ncbi:MAG: WXG100 family type VII secretion target [Anaerolineae bacterium]|nr:WXG100 family type VII secretion target [Anaerolineae bacterium]
MDLFQANSEVLQEVSQLFRQQADALGESLERFMATAENMRGHAWIGLGAEAFFDELDTLLAPEARKIVENLLTSADGVDKVAQTIEDGIARILSVAKSPL